MPMHMFASTHVWLLTRGHIAPDILVSIGSGYGAYPVN